MAKKGKKRKKKDLPRELERASALCLAFANTAVPQRDDRRKDRQRPSATRLQRYDDLVTWGQRMSAVGPVEAEQLHKVAAERPEDAAAILARALELRGALFRLFTAVALNKEPQAADLDTLNRSLRPRRVFVEGDGFRRGWGDPEALDRVLWPLAHSAAELLTSDRLRKVRQCGSKGCYLLFVFANRRRMWCDPNTCGNRPKGKRHHDYKRRHRLRHAGANIPRPMPPIRRSETPPPSWSEPEEV